MGLFSVWGQAGVGLTFGSVIPNFVSMAGQWISHS